MAQFDRMTVLQTLLEDALVPLYFHDEVSIATRITQALAAGGAHVIEFTNRGDFAADVFGELVRDVSRTHPDVMLGAGTVDDAATAALFIARGANFIVGPTFRDDIARLCNRRKIPYLPGCMTLNEIALAEESGVEIVKLFPGSVGGPDFVKAVRGPRPWTRIMPTGGVSSDEANLKAWFGAGVAAVGMGSNLVKDDWVKAGDFSRITDETRRALETIRAIRVR